MSKFSGKCDLYDELFVINESEEYRRNSVITINGQSSPIKNTCDKDLVPYFPFVCMSGAGNKNGFNGHYTASSWVDIEDADMMKHFLEVLKKYLRKCKRTHIAYDVDAALEVVSFGRYGESPVVRMLAERVRDYGNKASLPSVPGEARFEHRDWYRDALREEMIKYGYTDEQADNWCYKGLKTW